MADIFSEKLQELKINNQDPFKINKFEINSSIKEIKKQFSSFNQQELEKEKKSVKIAGRIMQMRNYGKLCFANFRCFDSDIQIIAIKKESFSKLDKGDIIGIEGVVCKTNSGELSIKIDSYQLLSKCLKPIPDLYYGFKNIEDRFRNRHVDMIINRNIRDIVIKRSLINRLIRSFFDQRGFFEMETPILVANASGAQARPFVTHHHSLSRNLQLRIATEISLKTLIIGGFEKIYEIGKVFRNEGIDSRHNPEFTTLEVYEAYQNSAHMMNITEKLIKFLFTSISSDQLIFSFRNQQIDLSNNFQKFSMLELIIKHTEIDFSKINNFSDAQILAQKHNVHLEKYQNTIGHVFYAFFEKFVEQKLIQPTFVYNYPLVVSPLAKSIDGNEMFADRFELFIGGLEFANGYSELNDPNEQKIRFELQLKEKNLGNEEIAALDNEFIDALCYGMPPTGGLGIGIDRLLMLFNNQSSIREVLTFSQLKNK